MVLTITTVKPFQENESYFISYVERTSDVLAHAMVLGGQEHGVEDNT